MTQLLNIIVSVILLTLWFVAGLLLLSISSNLSSLNVVDTFTAQATKLIFITNILLWSFVVFFIIIFILAATGVIRLFADAVIEVNNENYTTGISIFTIFILLLSIGVTIAVGVLASMAGTALRASSLYGGGNQAVVNSYQDSYIVVILSITSTILLTLGTIAYLYLRRQRKIGSTTTKSDSIEPEL